MALIDDRSARLIDDRQPALATSGLIDDRPMAVRTPGNVTFPDEGGSVLDATSQPREPVTQTESSPDSLTWGDALTGVGKYASLLQGSGTWPDQREKQAMLTHLGPLAAVGAGMALAPTGLSLPLQALSNYAVGAGTETAARMFQGQDLPTAGKAALTNPWRALDVGLAGLPSILGRFPQHTPEVEGDASLALRDLPEVAAVKGEPGRALSYLRSKVPGGEPFWQRELASPIRGLAKSDLPEAYETAQRGQQYVLNQSRLQAAVDQMSHAWREGLSPAEAEQVVAAMHAGDTASLPEKLAQAAQARTVMFARVADVAESPAEAFRLRIKNPSGESIPFQRNPAYGGPRVSPEQSTAGLTPVERAMRYEHGQNVGGELITTQARTGVTPAPDVLTDPALIEPGYGWKYSHRIAAAQAFGGTPTRMVVDAQPLYIGDRLAELIQALPEHSAERRMAESLAKEVYAPRGGFGNVVGNWAARKISDINLGQSWATNLSQANTSNWMIGTEWARPGRQMLKDPAVRRAWEIGGASDPGIAKAFGTTRDALPYRMLQGLEHGLLRSRQSAGVIPYAEDLGLKIGEKITKGQPLTQAEHFQAAELGLKAEDLAQKALQGFTARDVADIGQAWTHLTQFGLGPGEIGSGFRSPVGKLLGLQWKGFSVKQGQLFQDNVLALIRSGDPSLRKLGLQRLARFSVMQPAASLAASGTKAAISGRVPALSEVMRNALGSGTGLGGDLAGALFEGQHYGEGGLERQANAPLFSTLGRVGRMADEFKVGDAAHGIPDALSLMGGINPNLAPFARFSANAARNVLRDDGRR